MNKLEIACIVVGFVGMFFGGTEYKVEGKYAVVCYFSLKIISKFVFGAMVLLPLYFNYWK